MEQRFALWSIGAGVQASVNLCVGSGLFEAASQSSALRVSRIGANSGEGHRCDNCEFIHDDVNERTGDIYATPQCALGRGHTVQRSQSWKTASLSSHSADCTGA